MAFIHMPSTTRWLVIIALSMILSLFPPAATPRVVGWSTELEAQGRSPLPGTDFFFTNTTGAPLVNQQIWVFCYADTDPTARDLRQQLWVTTNAVGKPQPPLPPDCKRITALRERHEQPGKPSHGPAYWVFDASWRTGSGTPILYTSNCANGITCTRGPVAIREEWPLVVFNVVASIEWQPEPGSDFVDQLKAGLRLASAYLADLTDGYMTIGPVTIYTDGRNWTGADLRFQAANDLRPAADIGGIVPTTIISTTQISPTFIGALIFDPGAVYLGRYWDGSSAFEGRWDEADGYRTLVHEWGHYALFLYDEYQQRDGVRAYCTNNNLRAMNDPALASAMAFQHTASELWHPNHPQDPEEICLETDQYRHHHMTDWETLERWFQIQRVSLAALPKPSSGPDPGPPAADGPLDELFGRWPGYRVFLSGIGGGAGTAPPPFASTMQLQVENGFSISHALATQVYLVKQDPQRILYQGTAVGDTNPPDTIGEITVLGASNTDLVHIFADQYAIGGLPGQRFVAHTDPLDPMPLAGPEDWKLSLDLVYTMGFSRSLPSISGLKAVVNGDRISDLVDPVAHLCVPEASSCSPVSMVEISGNLVADFGSVLVGAELSPYGIIHITATNPDFPGIIRWFRSLDGVGPTHMPGGRAPLRDGMATVDLVDRSGGPSGGEPCNGVMIMPAANYKALATPVTVTIQSLVGLPLDIDVLTQSGQTELGATCTSKDSFRLTLFYNQEDVRRLGLSKEQEADLRILHYKEGAGWVIYEKGQAAPFYSDPDLNWVATTISSTGTLTDSLSGIYAIAWQPPSEP